MRLSARDQVIIGAVITILAAVAIFFLLIWPRFGEIAELETELALIEQETLQAETLVAQRKSAKEQAAETQVELLDIASRFPEAPELPGLIIAMQDVANRVGIDFIRLTPGTPLKIEGNANITAIPLAVQIEGTWEQYIEFMEELDGLRREVRVTQWQVNASPPARDIADTADADAEGEGGDTDTTTTTDQEAEPEDFLYVISSNVSLEAYMMEAKVSGGGGGGDGTPSAPE